MIAPTRDEWFCSDALYQEDDRPICDGCGAWPCVCGEFDWELEQEQAEWLDDDIRDLCEEEGL